MTKSKAAGRYMQQVLRVSMTALILSQAACLKDAPQRAPEAPQKTETVHVQQASSAMAERNAQHAAEAIPAWGKEHGFRMGKSIQLKVEDKGNGQAEGTYESEFMMPTDAEGVEGIDTFVICDTDSTVAVGKCADVTASEIHKTTTKTTAPDSAKPVR